MKKAYEFKFPSDMRPEFVEKFTLFCQKHGVKCSISIIKKATWFSSNDKLRIDLEAEVIPKEIVQELRYIVRYVP